MTKETKQCIGLCNIDYQRMYCPSCDRYFKMLPTWLCKAPKDINKANQKSLNK